MSTCIGSPAPHSCTHGDRCDWDWEPPLRIVPSAHRLREYSAPPPTNRRDRRALERLRRSR